MTYWSPVTCAIQLNFCSAADQNAPIEVGRVYGGTSTIRYRKEHLPEAALKFAVGSSSNADQQQHLSEYDSFWKKVASAGAADALHLHACTRSSVSSGALAKAIPLQVSSYKVHSVKPTAPLKVLSVVEEDAPSASSKGTAESSKNAKKGKAGVKQAAKGASASANNDSSPDPGDIGSKLVLFDQSTQPMAVGAEVELTVVFTGSVQEWDVGGIYTPGSKNHAQPTLLTHFEVALAKYAFPCPDHPQYRLSWELKSLQLPELYHTVITNGAEMGKKDLPQLGAVQYSFSRVGLLPAYVFAFAAFGGDALQEVSDTVDIADLASYATTDANSNDAAFSNSIPVRVACTRASGISESTLTRAMHVLLEAVRLLQDFFGCPLPLCDCPHLVLLFAPTMPYISGMEHHGCIFLNASIFKDGGKDRSGNNVIAQTELIVHEVAHHWAGNAVGLPFPVKEGICQILETCFGDVILGKPMRKLASQNIKDDAIQDTEKGKEFTGHSYQYALITIQNMIADGGFSLFQQHMQVLMKEGILEYASEEEEKGGREVMLLSGEPIRAPMYLSSEEFMHRIK